MSTSKDLLNRSLRASMQQLIRRHMGTLSPIVVQTSTLAMRASGVTSGTAGGWARALINPVHLKCHDRKIGAFVERARRPLAADFPEGIVVLRDAGGEGNPLLYAA